MNLWLLALLVSMLASAVLLCGGGPGVVLAGIGPAIFARMRRANKRAPRRWWWQVPGLFGLSFLLHLGCAPSTVRVVVKTSADVVATADRVLGSAIEQRSRGILSDPAWLALPAAQAEQQYRDRMRPLVAAVASVVAARAAVKATAEQYDKSRDTGTHMMAAVLSSASLGLGVLAALDVAQVPVPVEAKTAAQLICKLLQGQPEPCTILARAGPTPP